MTTKPCRLLAALLASLMLVSCASNGTKADSTVPSDTSAYEADTIPTLAVSAEDDIWLVGPAPLMGTPTAEQRQDLLELILAINALSLSTEAHPYSDQIALRDSVTVNILDADGTTTHTLFFATTHSKTCCFAWSTCTADAPDTPIPICEAEFENATCYELIAKITGAQSNT